MAKKLKILDNQPLSRFSTMRVGGPARYFCSVSSDEELTQAIDFARDKKIPYFILGNGSNVIFSSKGYDGLVIRNECRDLEIQGSKAVAVAGCLLSQLLTRAAENNLGGIEFLAGIPGTVGGAVYGNAGAWGRETGDMVEWVEVINPDGKVEKITADEMEFGYRTSRFKKMKTGPKPIITRVCFRLKPEPKAEINKKILKFIKDRSSRYDPYPSAGCVFKNIEVNDKIPTALQRLAKNGKVSAGLLIEQAGAKGLRQGNAKVSEKHANFIYNTDHARPEDIKALADKVKKLVKTKFGVELETEVEFIGF